MPKSVLGTRSLSHKQACKRQHHSYNTSTALGKPFSSICIATAPQPRMKKTTEKSKQQIKRMPMQWASWKGMQAGCLCMVHGVLCEQCIRKCANARMHSIRRSVRNRLCIGEIIFSPLLVFRLAPSISRSQRSKFATNVQRLYWTPNLLATCTMYTDKFGIRKFWRWYLEPDEKKICVLHVTLSNGRRAAGEPLSVDFNTKWLGFVPPAACTEKGVFSGTFCSRLSHRMCSLVIVVLSC